ncbi:hypothetical protein [Streptomyces sp. NBC_00102]|uniref:hypothetical protein n=1 Tax=Streptomyces sp. NBC_00102 TaxID=2975652 RepID=UPI0022590D52|nr:hypothetical protein [Streptomyces sp. NBC_00102]MCX5397855.1 hypothetical protein [Streptomyces sp. NBC_00102]
MTNTERAMVMLLEAENEEGKEEGNEDEGDPGEHAMTPGAKGSSQGFVLSNGQEDAYPDEDTVPLREALGLVEHIVGTGSWPAHARWAADR